MCIDRFCELHKKMKEAVLNEKEILITLICGNCRVSLDFYPCDYQLQGTSLTMIDENEQKVAVDNIEDIQYDNMEDIFIVRSNDLALYLS